VVLEPNTAGRACDGQEDTGDTELPVHVAAFYEPGGGEKRGDGGGHLVGAQDIVSRMAGKGHQISRNGDDAAATADGVNKGGQKHAAAAKEHDPQLYAVDGDSGEEFQHSDMPPWRCVPVILAGNSPQFNRLAGKTTFFPGKAVKKLPKSEQND
jgi:hypothetical protein